MNLMFYKQGKYIITLFLHPELDTQTSAFVHVTCYFPMCQYVSDVHLPVRVYHHHV